MEFRFGRYHIVIISCICVVSSLLVFLFRTPKAEEEILNQRTESDIFSGYFRSQEEVQPLSETVQLESNIERRAAARGEARMRLLALHRAVESDVFYDKGVTDLQDIYAELDVAYRSADNSVDDTRRSIQIAFEEAEMYIQTDPKNISAVVAGLLLVLEEAIESETTATAAELRAARTVRAQIQE